VSCHAEPKGEVEGSALDGYPAYAKEILGGVYAERSEVLRMTDII